MTLLTLGASKINQGDLQRSPKGECKHVLILGLRKPWRLA